MEQDPLTLLIGGFCGAGALLLVWRIANLGDALVAFTRAVTGTLGKRVKPPRNVSRGKKR